jgi:hypothetical protein
MILQKYKTFTLDLGTGIAGRQQEGGVNILGKYS